MKKEITKIKYKDGKYLINYDQKTAEYTEKIIFEGKVTPLEEFEQAFQELAIYHLQIAELPNDYIHTSKVRSLTVKHEDNPSFLISLSREVSFSNRPMNLTTPLIEYDYDGDNTQAVAECWELIKRLFEYAEAYMNGDNSQPKLFGNEENE